MELKIIKLSYKVISFYDFMGSKFGARTTFDGSCSNYKQGASPFYTTVASCEAPPDLPQKKLKVSLGVTWDFFWEWRGELPRENDKVCIFK